MRHAIVAVESRKCSSFQRGIAYIYLIYQDFCCSIALLFFPEQFWLFVQVHEREGEDGTGAASLEAELEPGPVSILELGVLNNNVHCTYFDICTAMVQSPAWSSRIT